MLEQGQGDFLEAAGREIRLYLSYAEANVVGTKLARVLGDRATVSRLTPITGGWAFTISHWNWNEEKQISINSIEPKT